MESNIIDSNDHEIYQKYGGGPTIEKVVNLFYEKVLTDDDLKNYFSTTDIKKLVSHQINFISSVLGGPKDENTDLEKAHKHFKISKEDFKICHSSREYFK